MVANELGIQADQGLAEVGRRPRGAERVVLVHLRHAEDGHRRVADELLDRAAVAFDRSATIEK